MNKSSHEELLDKVIDYVREIEGNSTAINAGTQLLSESLLNSMSLLSLVSRFEEELGITVDEDSLVPENFETPEKIVLFLKMNIARAASE